MNVYADTSFLASLYVLDANSTAAARRMKRATLPVLLSSIGEVELINAISLRCFRKELSSTKVKVAQALVLKDLEDGVLLVKALPSTVFERAKQMARNQTPRLGTRTIDILHVASALALGADKFFTFDKRQARLARAAGLVVA